MNKTDILRAISKDLEIQMQESMNESAVSYSTLGQKVLDEIAQPEAATKQVSFMGFRRNSGL